MKNKNFISNVIWEFFILSLNMSLKHELAFHKKIYTPNFPRKERIAAKAGNTFPEQLCTLQEQLHLAGSARGVWWLRLLRNLMSLRRYWTVLRTLVCRCFLGSLRGVLLAIIFLERSVGSPTWITLWVTEESISAKSSKEGSLCHVCSQGWELGGNTTNGEMLAKGPDPICVCKRLLGTRFYPVALLVSVF